MDPRDIGLLTAEEVRHALDYAPETGVFKWRNPRANRMKAGDIAGGLQGNGYIRIFIGYRGFMAHRLAWLYMHGDWPYVIDHINRNRTDNRISNLRNATPEINNRNREYPVGASSLPGAAFCSRSKRWRASILVNRIKRHLGMFDTAEEASAAYLAAKDCFHPRPTV